MLLLVLAYGHMGRLVDQHVGGLEHRIAVKPDRRAFAVLARLFLELGHPVQPANPGGAVQQPAQLSMGGDVALAEQDCLVGVDPAGNERCSHFADIRVQRRGIIVDSDRMQIGKKEKTFALLLHLDPALDRAKIVSEVQVAGRLDARDCTLMGHDPRAIGAGGRRVKP